MWLLPQLVRARTLALVRLAERHGLAEPTVLRGTGLDPSRLRDLRFPVTVAHESAAVANVLRHLPAAPVGLAAGLDLYLLATGALGPVLRTAGGPGEALTFFVSWVNSVPMGGRLAVAANEPRFRLRFEHGGAEPALRAFHTIRVVVVTTMVVREILGVDVACDSVALDVPRQPLAAGLDDFVGVPVTWDAPHAELVARLESPGAAVAGSRGAPWSRRVRGELHRTAPDADAREVATRLEISERSLRRRLADEGTTFRTLTADVRRGLAEELLRSGLSVSQTAQRLGYAGSSSFSRAFSRWHGVGPGDWVRDGAAGGSGQRAGDEVEIEGRDDG